MKINVHIKGKNFLINCGDGSQKIRWLAEVAMIRFDHLSGMLTGLPRGLKFEDGNMLNMDGIVNEHIQDEAHVWVVLKDDFEGNETTKKTDLKKGATRKKI